MTIIHRLRRAAISAALVVAGITPLNAQVPAFDGFIDDPATHSFDIFPGSDDWKFFRTSAYCYASVENDKGVLLIGYDRRRNQVHLAFWNTAITKYNTSDSTFVGIGLLNVIPGVGLSPLNQDWGSQKFLVAINKAGNHVFNAKMNGAQVLRSFSRFQFVTFADNQSNMLQTFKMPGSARALARLGACVPH